MPKDLIWPLFSPLLLLAGCGTYVPNITENPFADERTRSDFIQEIFRNIRCEVQDAVVKLYAENPSSIDPFNRNLGWFDSWAAQISLTLTIDEKSSLNPTSNLLPISPPTRIFNLNLGATASADAQRVDKIGAFFAVTDFKDREACPPQDRNRGPFILQSDLKLYDWLKPATIGMDNADVPAPTNPSGPNKSNVISHEVKFDIVTGLSGTPGWKLTTATVNQTGTFISVNRDRTQDLVVTFGPPDPQWFVAVVDPITRKLVLNSKTHKPLMRPTELAPAAASSAMSSDIGNAVSNGIINGLRFQSFTGFPNNN